LFFSNNGINFPGERISPLEALKAVTICGAYQYHEEHITGSIEAGKRADLVILEENPLTCDPAHIKDIVIYQTINGGEVTYQKGDEHNEI